MKLLFLHGPPASGKLTVAQAVVHLTAGRLFDNHVAVFLSCSRKTLEERVGTPDRVQRRKVTSKEGLDKCLARWNLVPVPRPDCYRVDTDAMTPAEAAAAIVAHFGL